MKLDEVLAVLTEAARARSAARVYLRELDRAGRPTRIVEGVVLDVSDGRDGRTRARFSIPTGSGEPVEIRVLVEGIERAESLVGREPDASAASGLVRRPTLEFGARSTRDANATGRQRVTPVSGETPTSAVEPAVDGVDGVDARPATKR
jgi:hypothetical protein